MEADGARRRVGDQPPRQSARSAECRKTPCTCGIGSGWRREARRLNSRAKVRWRRPSVKSSDLAAEHKINALAPADVKAEGLGKQRPPTCADWGSPSHSSAKAAMRSSSRHCDLGQGAEAETFKLEFRGGWDRYKRIKSVAEAFCGEADELKATMRVPDGNSEDGLEASGAQFAAIRDVLARWNRARSPWKRVPAAMKTLSHTAALGGPDHPGAKDARAAHVDGQIPRAARHPCQQTVEREACLAHGLDPDQVTTGAMIGVADLVAIDALDAASYAPARRAPGWALSCPWNWSCPHLYGWRSANPRPLTEPCRRAGGWGV